ncbi:MAG: DUF177 domain-containing protein [Gammaproteobacteria bacterium]|nr:DUF177 domain-containing protein [Gammaproteobacteria bacterium]
MSPTEKAPHGQLPAHIDPIQLAEKGAHLAGALSLKGMPRLLQACLNDGGEIQVDLQFGRDEGGDVLELQGNIRAKVHVACQRCLEPMTLELHADTRLLLLRPGERTDALAQEAEALTMDRPVLLSELVEDELLLVMPMVPMHPLDVCPAKEQVKTPAATRTGKLLSALRR